MVYKLRIFTILIKEVRINMNEKDRKKILIGSIMIVIALILLAVGVTYAYFNMQIKNNSETTSIEITTGELGNIELKGEYKGK